MRRLRIAAIVLTAAAATARADDGEGVAPAPDPAADAAPAPVAPADGKHAIRGSLVSKRDGTPAVGAVVVVMSADGATSGESVALTEEDGRYEVRVAPGAYNILVYYGDTTAAIANRIVVGADVQFGPFAVEESIGIGCVFFDWPSPWLETAPRFGLTVTRSWRPVARDQTHRAWIAPVVGADARTAVTTLELGARLAGAPGIPLVFVQEMQTHTLRVPIGLPAGSGGAADVSLRQGSNTAHGEARLVLGLERPTGAGAGAAGAQGAGSGGLEVLASAPIAEDKAWISAGLAADRDARGAIGAHGMLSVVYAHSLEHQLGVTGIAQALGDDVRDGWTTARWTSKLWDNRLELQAIGTAEQLAAPSTETIARSTSGDGDLDVTNRIGGRLVAKLRKRAHGYHQVELSAGGGAGTYDRARHADTSFVAGDSWQLRPNVDLELGVRAETRVFDTDRATVIAPRAALAYDFTKEGRSDVFLAYQRVPHLDDGAPGRWRWLDAQAHDELAAGGAYSRGSRYGISAGAAVRARRPVLTAEAPAAATPSASELGAEAWIRVDGRRTRIHASATTLGRIATVVGQRTLIDGRDDDLVAGVTARATPDGADGGAALRWKHTGSTRQRHNLDLDVGLEVYTDATGPSGRLVAGATW